VKSNFLPLPCALGQIQALSIGRDTHDRVEPPSVALVRTLEGV